MSSPVSPSPLRPTGFVHRTLDIVGNIWFGVAVLSLIFVYSSIGSAAPPIRQGMLADWLGIEFLRFEKSEMQWFSAWPFQVLIGLLCLSIIATTIRRVPFTLAKAGVWMTHLGIVVMIVASFVYFTSKVEGDVLVYHSRAWIRAPGMDQPVSMVIRPGAAVSVASPDGPYEIRVGRIDPDHVLPDGPDAGRRVPLVRLDVRGGALPHDFARVFVIGHDDRTEDFLVSGSRWEPARAVIGRRWVDESLEIALAYDEPKHYFYHAHQPPVRGAGAIYARQAGQRDWQQYRLTGLPHYGAWMSDHESVWPASEGDLPPLRPLDLAARAVDPTEALPTLHLRVTDYLPYAELRSRWTEGGGAVSPLLRFRLVSGPSAETHELLAAAPFARRKEIAEGFVAEFFWAADEESRASILQEAAPHLVVHDKATDRRQIVTLSALTTGAEQAIDGTPYRIALRDLFPPGMVSTGSPGVVLVKVMSDDLSFQRLIVAGKPEAARDFDDALQALQAPQADNLEIAYVSAGPRLVFVGSAANAPVELLYVSPEGKSSQHQLEAGGDVELMSGVRLVVDTVIERAHQVTRPQLIPPRLRRPLQEVGKTMSLVRVEVADPERSQSVWLPFNAYAFPDAQRAYPGRFPYRPVNVTLSDGREIELMYSRWRDPLPSGVVLDRFILKTYPGGDRPSDYISLVRFEDPDGWSGLTEIKSNQPAAHGPYWYFQAQWDPQAECYTVLGVGNRRAVGGMLAGVCISIAGMVYAFYVRPVLNKRRTRRAAGQVVAPAEGAVGDRAILEPVEVARGAN